LKIIIIHIECDDYEDLAEIKEDIRNSGGIIEDSGIDYLNHRGWIKTAIQDDFWKVFDNTKSRNKIIL
jgi:hypothetical protein